MHGGAGCGTAGCRASIIHKKGRFINCHPYSSYQRGTNENLNKLLRRIFPKDTGFDQAPDEELIAAAERMNSYPDKVLGGATAAGAFANFLAEI